MEETKENIKPVIIGEFSAQRFYDILAMILSQKYGVKITVKVSKEDERLEQEKQVV